MLLNHCVISSSSFSSFPLFFNGSASLTSLTCDQCLEPVKAVFKRVQEFFARRYADARICMRGISSIEWGGITLEEIGHLQAFESALLSGATQADLTRYFFGLSHRVRSLFVVVDDAFVHQYAGETDINRLLLLKNEMEHECRRVAIIQRLIFAVRACFEKLRRGTASGESVLAPRFWEFNAETMFTRPFWESQAETASTRPFWQFNTLHIDLNIPNTVPYVQGAIPAANQQKAAQIAALKAQFDALPGGPRPIPQEFGDGIVSDVMTMPIFDASHPAVQTSLPALRGLLAGTMPGLMSNFHTARHTIDMDSLESHIAAGTSWAPAKCPQCRHPEHGRIRREYLRIDTGLQDEILTFLRAATGA